TAMIPTTAIDADRIRSVEISATAPMNLRYTPAARSIVPPEIPGTRLAIPMNTPPATHRATGTPVGSDCCSLWSVTTRPWSRAGDHARAPVRYPRRSVRRQSEEAVHGGDGHRGGGVHRVARRTTPPGGRSPRRDRRQP